MGLPGGTPLITVCRDVANRAGRLEDNLSVVRLLLDRGYDPDAYDDYGRSPLRSSLIGNVAPLTSLLLEKGANPDVQGGPNHQYFPLADMSFYGIVGSVALLLKHGADPNVRDSTNHGNTPLMNASYIGNIDIMKLLLERGAQVDMVDDTVSTALMHASTRRHEGAVRLLLDHGASTCVRNSYGETSYDVSESAVIRNIINLFNMRAMSIYSNKDRSRSYMGEEYSDLCISFSSQS